MKTLILILATFGFSLLAVAQNCNLNKLSAQYDFSITKHLPEVGQDSTRIEVSVYDKEMRVLTQIVKFNSAYLLPSVFENCNLVRSYQTSINSTQNAEMNDYGDFVVADFNFDGKDDFAVKCDSRINGGPSYIYFLQDDKNWFVKDIFLSDEMKIFPSSRSKKDKTLITRISVDGNRYLEKKYKHCPKKKNWKLKKERVLSL